MFCVLFECKDRKKEKKVFTWRLPPISPDMQYWASATYNRERVMPKDVPFKELANERITKKRGSKPE